jgi:hypothetical protein
MMQPKRLGVSIASGEDETGHNKRILLDGSRFQSFRVSYGTPEGCPERVNGRSHLGQGAIQTYKVLYYIL